MLKPITLALGLITALGVPAAAMNSITNVPSFWPVEGAFDTGTASPSISSKSTDTPAPLQQSRDR